ncbi:MAG: serine/threonine protein kinase [Oligoflexia bacterium]|nr:serine/threonine protein kinase [Oligoflexia bacterium]
MKERDGEITTPIPRKRRTSVADRVRVRRGVDAATATADKSPQARARSRLRDQAPARMVVVHKPAPSQQRVAIQRGSVVAGTYRIVDRIARGGTAIVYRAWHITMAREVALKVLTPPGTGNDDIFEARFIREARTLAGLAHPNIIEVIDFGRLEDGRCYLAMEFIDGPRLSDLFRDPDVSATQRLDVLIQVAKGIAHAHANGVVHRDIKLSNAMAIQRKDRAVVKVLDFGLAKILEDDQDITQQGMTMGSPHFMSPEQARGQDLDERTDIYSMGILTWIAFTGKYPFNGSSVTATMVQHCVDPVPWLSRVDTVFPVPQGLCATVRRCLAKDREHRFATADALIEALQDAHAQALQGRIVTLDDPAGYVHPSPANTHAVALAVDSAGHGRRRATTRSVRRLALLGCLLVSTACLWWQEQGVVQPPWTVAESHYRRH